MKKYFLIILTMAVAYGFSSYAGTSIFVNNTPSVNYNYLADLQNIFKKGVNNVYLAFSIFNQKPVKKNIAVVYPTLVPVSNNMSGKLGSPTAPTTTKVPTIKVPEQIKVAMIDPASIPANLFKRVANGVSAYEKGKNKIYKFNSGTTIKIIKIKLPDGKIVDAIDLSSK